MGYAFETCCDTEIILNGYLEYGTDFVTRMNGIFAFAILDPVQDCLFLFRDRMGVKPLFYTVLKDQIVFSSEIKGLFAFPGITPRLGKRGLNEIFSLGPARTPGCGVFENIHEVLPGTYLCCRGTDLHTIRYWQLESRPHTDSEEETVEKTAFLVQDAHPPPDHIGCSHLHLPLRRCRQQPGFRRVCRGTEKEEPTARHLLL